MQLKIFLSFLLFPYLVLFAANPVDTFVQNPLLENANISLLVKDLKTNETLYQYRPENLVTHASTMKLVTTATILELFGPDFRFETRLEIDGTISKDSTLNGNLYIRGGGDPTLGSEKLGEKDFLPRWVQAIKLAGINKITGRIVADETIFEDQVLNPKWTWEDIGNYYAPGIHGISYMDNTYRMVFRSGAIGTTPEILRVEPEIGGLEMDNHLKSTSTDHDKAYFYGAPYSLDRSVYGEIPANKAEFTVKGDIPNPALLLARHLHKKLTENGVKITDFAVVRSIPANSKLIYKYYSPALKDIITETNIKSNNHFAEYLFKYISTKNNSVGSTNESISAIRKHWKALGLPMEELYQYDGCGLSPADAVSAKFFVDLLTYMKTKSPYAADYYNSLPVSGGRGTLSTMFIHTALEGKVHAKSGTIENVKCYAGYIEQKNRTLVFAIMINYHNGSTHEVVKVMEKFLLEIVAPKSPKGD